MIFFNANYLHNTIKWYTFAVSNQSIEGKVMTKKAFYQANHSKTLVLCLIVTSGCWFACSLVCAKRGASGSSPGMTAIEEEFFDRLLQSNIFRVPHWTPKLHKHGQGSLRVDGGGGRRGWMFPGGATIITQREGTVAKSNVELPDREQRSR